MGSYILINGTGAGSRFRELRSCAVTSVHNSLAGNGPGPDWHLFLWQAQAALVRSFHGRVCAGSCVELGRVLRHEDPVHF